MEPKKPIQALKDPSWVEAMQNELLQFKLLNVWTLVDLPRHKWAISTKWVFRNKKDERGIVVKNKARLVAQGHTQEEGIDYDEVFAPVARIEAIRLFLAYASFKDFVVYQMDVNSAFLYGKIEEEAPRAWYETLLTYLLDNGFHKGQIDKTLFIKRHKDDILSMGELSFFLGLQVKQKSNGIFISQDKYVAEILKKFDFASVKTTSTPMETNKALVKDEEAEDVDVHLYRSMIGSLMYLTASRPDIMFAVCACARDSPFDLEAFSDSDYAGASLDRKSTTGGCQFLGKRLISWQCKKQTIVANSTTEAEYVAAANCCGQVLWIQNQMLDYGFNFMNTKIYIDNESTICIVKNPVFHSKTKHIEIRHHFIRDSYEKKLIQVIKIHTDQNVADLLTKAFDVSRVKTAKDKHIEFLVGDEAVHKELGDRMERAATTASSLEAEQDSGSGPRCQDTILGDVDAQTRGYSGEDIPLFSSMITAPDTSPSIITSSPSLSPQHTPVGALSPLPPPITETSPPAKESAPIPHESPLQSVHSLGRDEGSMSLNELMDLVTQLTDKVGSLENELKNTKKVYETAISKLVKRVKKLEKQVKIRKASRRTKIVLSEDDVIEEDSSKQGRSLIEELDMDADISLVPLHAEIQEKISDETEVLLEEEKTTEIVQDQGSGEKGEQEVFTADTELKTADIPISTASETPEVSTAAESLVYIRRSEKKKKDKGKAIIIEDESVPKKSKKQEQEERLGHEEAVRLQEQIDEEERKRIARDAEIAKQLQEEYDKAGKKEAVTKVDTAHVIDWNDPSVIRYHALQNRPRSEAEVRKNMMVYLKNQGGYKMKDFKGMSYDDIRPIFEKVWDQIHSFVPMDSEEEVPRLKRAGQDVEAKPAKRQRTKEVLESVQEQTDEEPKTDELSQEQLNQLVIIVQDKGMNVEALQTKYPIIG
ncbi:putative ribonuclease H-like domain-containing protein [Tanacetum coccineum]|uniref:Ribonuclease H-like domain-containing protein n=1 Tax=Tanacetum coccineum TaxID=301880 RepID=A0ABQ4ZNQ3_9ASTR